MQLKCAQFAELGPTTACRGRTGEGRQETNGGMCAGAGKLIVIGGRINGCVVRLVTEIGEGGWWGW